MQKIPPCKELCSAISHAKIFGYGFYEKRRYCLGELEFLKNQYSNIWVNILEAQHKQTGQKRLLVELAEPPSWLEKENKKFNQHGKTMPSHFFCYIDFSEDNCYITINKVFSLLDKEKQFKVLHGISLDDFGYCVMGIHKDKKVM